MEGNHPLRLWRKRENVTLAALGRQVGVSPSHLSEIERGLDDPSMGLATRLSRATGGEVDIGSFARAEAAE